MENSDRSPPRGVEGVWGMGPRTLQRQLFSVLFYEGKPNLGQEPEGGMASREDF